MGGVTGVAGLVGGNLRISKPFLGGLRSLSSMILGKRGRVFAEAKLNC